MLKYTLVSWVKYFKAQNLHSTGRWNIMPEIPDVAWIVVLAIVFALILAKFAKPIVPSLFDDKESW